MNICENAKVASSGEPCHSMSAKATPHLAMLITVNRHDDFREDRRLIRDVIQIQQQPVVEGVHRLIS